jgi:hypothetical protein
VQFRRRHHVSTQRFNERLQQRRRVTDPLLRQLASGIAFVTAFSNLAGFAGTYLVKWLNERFGNFTYALLATCKTPKVMCMTTPCLVNLPTG